MLLSSFGSQVKILLEKTEKLNIMLDPSISINYCQPKGMPSIVKSLKGMPSIVKRPVDYIT